MSVERLFFDTNILVYAYDFGAPAKQVVAQKILKEAMAAGTGILSVQVLGEFFHAAVIREKVLSPEEGERAVHDLSAMPVELADAALVHAAIALHRRFGQSFWDSMILATAKRAGSATVLSEDFNSGQDYDGVKVRNPFVTS